MTSLEHIHQTSQWYTDLLASVGSEQLALKCDRVVVLHTKETWLESSSNTGQAETMVRDFMTSVFQSTDEVSSKVKAMAGEASTSIIAVPGSHFSMLHEPNVATLALKICSKLDDAGALDL